MILRGLLFSFLLGNASCFLLVCCLLELRFPSYPWMHRDLF